jgi:hypothetical protein
MSKIDDRDCSDKINAAAALWRFVLSRAHLSRVLLSAVQLE